MKCLSILLVVFVVYGRIEGSALLKSKSQLNEIELETAETGYAPVAIYDDHGLAAYGKKAEDYGSYGHQNKGYKDYYGDNGYGSHGLNKYSDYHDSDHYGAKSGSQGHEYGQGVYERNRGYGYEKHYAYDKELSSHKNGGAHSDHKSHYGAHDHSGVDKVNAYDKYGHNKYAAHAAQDNNDYGKYGHLLDTYGKKDYAHSSHTKAVPIYQTAPTYQAAPIYQASAPTYHASAPTYHASAPAYHAQPPPTPVYVPAQAPAHVYQAAPQPAVTTVYHTKSVPHYQPVLSAPATYQTIGDAYSSGHGVAYY